MAQHDYDIANQTFPATRADINNALDAIVSQNSGASAPTTTYAYMFWYDTTNNKLKQRNAADDAWIDLFDVNQTSDTATPSNGSAAAANLILNGAMVISQRGISGTSTADIYTTDRFALGHGAPVNAMSWDQSTDAPDNFKYSLKVTAGTGASASTTGYAALRQAVEGQNMAHLGFGTSAAKDITLSFWVKCSLTGTFGVSVRNQAGNRAYGGTYVINSANTWEYKTVAIPADTSGTWPTDNGVGIMATWDLGAGSNYDIAAGSWTTGSNMFGVESTVKLTETTGATFYITGVCLNVGDQAPANYPHRSYGEELALCQRYYQRKGGGAYEAFGTGSYYNTTNTNLYMPFPAGEMRATPSFSYSALTDFTMAEARSSFALQITAFSYGYASKTGALFQPSPASSGTADTPYVLCAKGTSNAWIAFDAEL